VRDHVIPEPGTPFDQELWDECQKVNIFCIADHPDIIKFPRELKGHLFDPRKEREFREDLYTLRVMAKVRNKVKRVIGAAIVSQETEDCTITSRPCKPDQSR